MYNLASKILGPLFDPLTLAIVLAACALLAWKRRRLAFRLLVAAIALLLVFTSRVTVGALVGSLENQYRDSGLDVPPAQAIVVLGGTIQMPSAIHHLTGLVDPSDRLLVAFRLYRVSAGIKRPRFRRFCGQRNPAIGQDAVPTLQQFLNLPT
jgi:uncharacterized SAM-binding protein YcdF (DUF218 family)